MQQDIFDVLYEKYIITKPIRLIEMFAGYGSQHFALTYLGLEVESWRIVEWAVPSIQAYKDAHFPNDNFDYSSVKSFEVIIDILFDKGISVDYNQPMTKEQIQRKGEKWCRQVFNNICATNNLVNIQNVKGEYLEIVDTDKYEYIMTYSFPCQDLSLAGKRAGMSDTSTRSGMLWEVERILDECEELPQILLMENVPQVIGKDNVEYFNKWQLKLESLGYKNYHQNLIATDYGIPQTRNRTFMISILGDYSYTFPKPIPLKLKLKDMLEDEVDEKYYLSDKFLNYCTDMTDRNGFIRDEKFKPLNLDKDINANTITTSAGNRPTDNFIKIPEATKKGYAEARKGDGVYIQNIKGKRGMVQKGKMQTLKTSPDTGVVVKNNLKSKLCNELIEKSIVKENDVIKHSYTNNKLDDERLVPNHNISPTLDTRCDCLGVVVNYGIATNESKEWQKPPLEEKSRTLLSNKSNCGVGVIVNQNIKNINDENKTFSTLGTNCGSSTSAGGGVVKNNLRIRKLTPKECFRLMGVKDEDYERIAKNQSNASLYHLAGDSIVVNVLEAIFKELLNK